MTNIILCGCPGSGKTQLAFLLKNTLKTRLKDYVIISNKPKEILERHGIRGRVDYNCCDDFYESIQEQIIFELCQKENEFESLGKNFVTCNSIINALVLLKACFRDHSKLHDVLNRPDVLRSLERYRNSLVVLVGPTKFVYDDGRCLKLKDEDWLEVKNLYVNFCTDLNIPFIDVRSVDPTDRLEEIRKALQGTISLDSSLLQLFATDQQLRTEEKIVQNNFSHFVKPSHTSHISIPTVKVYTDKYEQSWTQLEGQSSRFIHRYGHTNLACLHFDIKVKPQIAQRLLLGGILINGKCYAFLGCSSSGLKERKCYLWKGSQTEADVIIRENGDFDEIRTVSKRLAKIGLLFSGVKITSITLTPEQFICEDDFEKEMTTSEKYVFSDGCGEIGSELATRLTAELNDTSLPIGYCPSVFQVRIQGYKGVLAIDHKMDSKSILVRPSMEKFKTHSHPYLCVCDYSKPYTFGNLNKQYIMLLSSLGVPDDVFVKLHNEHLNCLRMLTHDSEAAIRTLQWQNKFDIAQMIMTAGALKKLSEKQYSFVIKSLKEVKQKEASRVEKLRILVPKSRNIFGVCDPYKILRYGECFIRVTIDGLQKTLTGKVVVCKNPCYLAGDVRVLTAVDPSAKPEVASLNHLVDCIVFPSQGKRPHPNEIAGSDLDGDQFFVTWDEDLIPPSITEPYGYPGVSAREQGEISTEKIFSYFSNQNEVHKLLALVHLVYNKYADIRGVRSQECERLGQMFSRVVDASKSGDNVQELRRDVKHLDDKIGTSVNEGKFVWSTMRKKAEQFQADLIPEVVADNVVTNEFVHTIAEQKHGNITPYERFRFFMSYLGQQGLPQDELVLELLDQFGYDIQFTTFSVDEKKDAIVSGIPKRVVMNALNCSRILCEEELKEFQLNKESHTWNLLSYFDHDDFQWNILLNAVTHYDNTMVILHQQNDVIVVFQILKKLDMGNEQPVEGGIMSSFFYSRHFGYKRRYILGNNYFLDLSDTSMQVYRDKALNKTFIKMRSLDATRDKKFMHSQKIEDDATNIVSVDLQRFHRRILESTRKHPVIRQQPFEGIEIYVRSQDNECPYLDIYQANDGVAVSVLKETFDETSGDDETPDFETVFVQSSSVNDKVTEALPSLLQIACDRDPFKFHAMVHSMQDVDIDAVAAFRKLVENMLTISVPFKIPDEDVEILLACVISMNHVFAKACPSDVLTIVVCLTRMGAGIHHIEGVIDNFGKCTTLNEITGLLQKWENLYFLSLKTAVQVLDNAISVDAVQHQAERYLAVQGKQCIWGLLNEMSVHTCELSTSSNTGKQCCISLLRVESTDLDSNLVHMYRMEAVETLSTFAKGQCVAIARQRNVNHGDGVKAVCCIGFIQSIQIAPFSVSIKVEGEIPHVFSRVKDLGITRYWQINLVGNIVTYRRVMVALETLKGHMNNQLMKCVSDAKGNHHQTNQEMFHNQTSKYESEGHLNCNQNIAVNAALQHTISLIHGPPGTGKTEVACEIIRSLLHNDIKRQILVVAETNIAIDNIARRLRRDTLIVRIGPTEGIANDLYDVSLEGQIKRIADREAKRTVFRDQKGDLHRNKRIQNSVLTSVDVVLTTCSGAGDVCLDGRVFPFVLVDEATQALEPTLLCSLAHGAEQLVLIGDPQQLGPTVIEDNDFADLKERFLGHANHQNTLFHRLYAENDIGITFLDVQYRMHEAIAQFPSEVFYKSKLQTGTGNRPMIVFPWPDRKRPICFINVDSKEQKNGSSFYNKSEARVVSSVVSHLLSLSEEESDQRLEARQIGVITFYRAQVEELKTARLQGVMISTVDGFQGQEKDVIIVSTVRSNALGSVGFCADPNRLNVMLTRAKRGLIVVGNKNTLSQNELWNKWLCCAPELNVSKLGTQEKNNESKADGRTHSRDQNVTRDYASRGRQNRVNAPRKFSQNYKQLHRK